MSKEREVLYKNAKYVVRFLKVHLGGKDEMASYQEVRLFAYDEVGKLIVERELLLGVIRDLSCQDSKLTKKSENSGAIQIMQGWKFSQKRYTTSEKFKSAHWADFFCHKIRCSFFFFLPKKFSILYMHKKTKKEI